MRSARRRPQGSYPALFLLHSHEYIDSPTRRYGKSTLLVRLPVIRLFPRFFQVLPACFGYIIDSREHGKPIATQFRVRLTCRRRSAREDNAKV
jgi:hypothetical protein